MGAYFMYRQYQAAKESARDSREAAIAQAMATGRAAAKEKAFRQDALAARAKEAEQLSLETAANVSKKKRGVQSTYTASYGAGAGMTQGTSMGPVGT